MILLVVVVVIVVIGAKYPCGRSRLFLGTNNSESSAPPSFHREKIYNIFTERTAIRK